MLNPFMLEAIKEAEEAARKGEIPVGAVVVCEGSVVGRGHNLRETLRSATAHAEVVAIERVCEALDRWRLDDCDLYVTLEPCPMCAGAIINSRIRRVYFGACDEKAGACGSVTDLLRMDGFNHKPEVYEGIMEEECAALLREFFKRLR